MLSYTTSDHVSRERERETRNPSLTCQLAAGWHGKALCGLSPSYSSSVVCAGYTCGFLRFSGQLQSSVVIERRVSIYAVP